jgi:NAD(P)-dependent dehydrogenase (short-subunit alcohol dehydrogenase family)
MDLTDTVAVVTGAAAGIGRATSLALATAGADVVLADINEDGAATAAAEIEAAGRRAIVVRTDVREAEQVHTLVERSIAWQGHCDVFVSNVGVGCMGLPHEFTDDEWRSLVDVNLMSAVWPLRVVVPHMLERSRGHLVFVTSGAGFEGTAERGPYNVAKFGIVGLAESVARALKDTGVGVTLVVPGAIESEGWKSMVIARAAERRSDEIERIRTEQHEQSSSFPPPQIMADAIVDGIRHDRYAVVQDNPYEPDWFAKLHEHKGRDLDGFVLGG